MANRLIGIELGPGSVRVAILTRDRRGTVVAALEEYRGGATEQLAAIARLTAGPPRLGDRIATCLPAGAAFSRTLRFPFGDRRKIAAAAPLELASRLPVALDACQTVLHWPAAAASGEVVAAAVDRQALGDFLKPFDELGIPLHIIDLAPYGVVAGLADRIGTGALVCAGEAETCLALVIDGALAEYRVWPGVLNSPGSQALEPLLRECALLGPRRGRPDLVFHLAGSAVAAELPERFRERGLRAAPLRLSLAGRAIPPAFIPATALALRAAAAPETSFNLREGAFACRSEAAALKKQLLIAAALLGLIGLTLGVTAALQYRAKARQAERLRQELVQLYQESFPGAEPGPDVALQMAANLRELREHATALGIAGPAAPLPILRLLAELPALGRFEVEELATGPDEVRLTGHTDSFETVDRIKEHLGKSPLFSAVEVAESRKSLDGSRVDLRLRLPLAAAGKGTP